MKVLRKYSLYSLAVVILGFSLVLYRTIELGRGDAKSAFLENLNRAGMMLGPEGIQFDAHGNLYTGDAQGIIWILEGSGAPRMYAQLDQVQHVSRGPIQAGGIAIDPAGNLYVAVYGFGGGSVLRVDAGSRQVRLFADKMGVANFVLIDGEGSHLWVSDCRRSGRLLRYRLGDSLPAQPDLTISGLESPNGLALAEDEKSIYAAETCSGTVARVDLTATQAAVTRVINLTGALAVGSLDGLAFDPRDKERRFLYVAENLRGMFTVLDLRANPVRIAKQIRLSTMGGRPCPASMVIRDGYLYFTDIWSCNPIRILLGIPRLREHVYRFQVIDLAALY